MKEIEYLPDFKICSKCGQKKPQIEFHLNPSNSDSLHSHCRDCKRENRTFSHEYYYGIIEAQYEVLLKSQGGVCAICGQPETMKHQSGKIRTLSVDHDHKINKIRDLLCSKCNRGIGNFNDNPERLEAAAKYLRSH